MLTTLETPRLLLRPFGLDDALVVQQLAGAKEVASTTVNIPHPYEDGMAEEWIASHEPKWEEKSAIALAITTPDDGVVGAVSLQLSLSHKRAELGYWVGVPYWNKGYATEASEALVGFGFSELDLNRIQSRHMARNPASGRVMQKIGMTIEGTLRQHMLVRDQFEDMVFYSILECERLSPH